MMDPPIRTFYRNETVQIPAIMPKLPAQPCLEGYTFEDCYIIGPAVLIGDVELNDAKWVTEGGQLGALLWIVDDEEGKIGALRCVDCVFNRCTFQGIGLAVSPEQSLMFRLDLGTIAE